MATSASAASTGWQWPEDMKAEPSDTKAEIKPEPPSSPMPGAFFFSAAAPTPPQPSQPSQPPPRFKSYASPPPPKPTRPKTYPPRTCRICLEVVLPTTHAPSPALPDMLQSTPQVSYMSEDAASGRLIRPCRCKGSSQYVHEGCLQSWRHADPGYAQRNYWQCPTCGFRYRLERMAWGRAISSQLTQLALTLAILLLTMFLLGFVADPIINLYLDPYSTLASGLKGEMEPSLLEGEEGGGGGGWAEHLVKGLASLGLLSFIKVFLALGPWQWWNLRASGILGGGGRGTGGSGRERVASISWVVVAVGVATFLWGVYKGVRAWSRRTLEKASERVMDVPLQDDDDDEE